MSNSERIGISEDPRGLEPIEVEIPGVKPMDRIVRYSAYAKVNLSLGVVGRRHDGYHDIITLMTPILLHDSLSLSVRPGPAGVKFACQGLAGVPHDRNLAYRAAVAYQKKAGFDGQVDMHLHKRIPVGAGMGGGSSDAGAVLAALDSLAPQGARLGSDTLLNIGVSLGADVPFFAGCNSSPPLWEAALCRSIGEKITPLHIPNLWLAVAFFKFGIATSEAYRLWDELQPNPSPSQGEAKMHALLRALVDGDIERAGKSLWNDLEISSGALRPEILEMKRRFLALGALGAVMTGSGSAVIALARSREDASRLALGAWPFVAQIGVKEIIVTRTGVDTGEN